MPFDLWIRDRKKIPIRDPGSGINIQDHFSENLVSIFLVKNASILFYVANPDPGSSAFLTLDPGSGMEKLDYGIGDKHNFFLDPHPHH